VFPSGSILQRFLQYPARALGALAALRGNPEFAAEITQRCHPVARRTAYILATDPLTQTNDHGYYPKSR
jgi:hypothetical protein